MNSNEISEEAKRIASEWMDEGPLQNQLASDIETYAIDKAMEAMERLRQEICEMKYIYPFTKDIKRIDLTKFL